MDRLTFEGDFCTIAMCQENPCPYDNSCTQRQVWDRLKAYEDTGLEPETCAEYKKFEDEAVSKGVTFKRIIELMEAEKDGRLVVLPCKVGYSVDKLFSHNEVIALWYDKPGDKDHSYLLWRGEAWRLPDKYKDQRILKFKGIIPERISEADTLNLQVTPYILTREEAEAALKGCED